ncbi:MAG: four helix bundle protein [Candidatus Omnitrophica bacterium]|nr:four helix bundle protein [Candidatus Omnitrophota bacterium]
MNKKIQTYQDLIVWQEGMVLAKFVYEVCSNYPDEEKYGIVIQMKRAAVSIPSNIAEGFRRSHKKEFKQFLSIARGSLAELETQVMLSYNLGFLNNEIKERLLSLLSQLGRKITALMKSIVP